MKLMHWMLALAAVSLMAAACSSTTASSATPAKDTVTTDDIAPTTDVPADTAAPADVLKTDTAPATDVPVAADVTATASDKGCLAAADKTYLDGLNADSTKKAAFGDASLTCTLKKGCLAKSGDAAQQQCIADCLQTLTPLTANCAMCYGGYSWCGAKKCLADCAADPLSAACSACLGTNCDPVKNACAAGQ